MKAIISRTITLILISTSLTFGQTTYIWIGGNSGNFTTAANWAPSRLNGQVTDILIFNTGSMININNVQQQTIGQLKIQNNTHIILSPASGNPKVLSINGGVGEDLIVDSNSILEVFGNTPQLGLYLKAGSTASIYGSIVIRGQQSHYIDAESSNSIIFHNGSILTQNSPGYVFTNSGTANIVIFENGSNFIVQNILSSTPFGLSAPSSKVSFNSNSNFILKASNNSALNLKGRVYGNFILDMNSNIQINESFTSNTSFNGITIKDGTILNIINTNSSFTPDFNINGDLNVNGNLSFTNNFKINFSGSTIQTIEGNGSILLPSSITSINFNNLTEIILTKDLFVGCPVNVNTNLSLINSKLTANTSLTSNSSLTVNNGYIIGTLTKYFSNNKKSQNFEIGTDNGYSPVTITFGNISQAGFITVKATSTVHPQVQDSTIALKRFWTITNYGVVSNNYSAVFNYLSCDFNTNFYEYSDESNMILDDFNGLMNSKKMKPVINLRDTLNNRIGISRELNYGDFTFIKNSGSQMNVDNVNLSTMDLKSKINDSSLPKEFGISQNYPNPFNPSTKISYNLPFANNVTIKIFDINGRLISTLVNGSQEAGNYTVQFNAQNISSGIYFYTIFATNNQNSYEKTLKMILTK